MLTVICIMEPKFANSPEGTIEKTFWGYRVLWGVATTAIGVKGVILCWNITITIEVLPYYASNTIFSYFIVFIVLTTNVISTTINWASYLHIVFSHGSRGCNPIHFPTACQGCLGCRNKQHAKKLVLFLLMYVLL